MRGFIKGRGLGNLRPFTLRTRTHLPEALRRAFWAATCSGPGTPGRRGLEVGPLLDQERVDVLPVPVSSGRSRDVEEVQLGTINR